MLFITSTLSNNVLLAYMMTPRNEITDIEDLHTPTKIFKLHAHKRRAICV